MKRNEENLWDFYDVIRRNNLYILGVLGGRKGQITYLKK